MGLPGFSCKLRYANVVKWGTRPHEHLSRITSLRTGDLCHVKATSFAVLCVKPLDHRPTRIETLISFFKFSCFSMKLDPETELFSALLELQYGQEVTEKIKKIAPKIPWVQGWPEDDRAFWNAEAFLWDYKIQKEKRALISRKLQFLREGKNLDLGCGSYSYLPSLGIDIAEKMLLRNQHCTRKIRGDLEQPLPFPSHSFDSVTAIFVLNYIRKYGQLIREVRRVLKKGGFFVVVLSKGKLNHWQQQKEVTSLSPQLWKRKLNQAGFIARAQKEEELFFCYAQKTKNS